MEVVFRGIKPSLKLTGKAKYVFAMLDILATTELLEDDVYWWSVRADILAKDRDMMLSKLPINERLNMRRN